MAASHLLAALPIMHCAASYVLMPADKQGPYAKADVKTSQDLQSARLLAAPFLAAASRAPTPAAGPKGAKGPPKADGAGVLPAAALTQLQQAAEACEAAMLKLSSLSSVAGHSQSTTAGFLQACTCIWTAAVLWQGSLHEDYVKLYFIFLTSFLFCDYYDNTDSIE